MSLSKGVILAGGNGSRLGTSEAYPKAAALVYDKPAIAYPLQTLKDMGCDSAVIVASPTGIGALSKLVKDGADYGLDVEYKVQREPNGVAGALDRVANNVKGLFPLILGDCYYDPAPVPVSDNPTMFWHEFPTATEHSIWVSEANAIFEKPRHVDVGKKAIIGYVYDERVFEFIDQMAPAHNTRELEIVDIHNFYRNLGADMVQYQGYFADMGTPDGLMRAAQHEQNR